MGIGPVIGPRIGAIIGPRIGAGRSLVATTTTQTVSVTDSADPVITGGDAFSYAVQYSNTGSISALTVQVQITLDASLTYVSSGGTGWSISVAGQVVTCTRASAATGNAPLITINVTTGGSAVVASTTAVATASNAGTANGSQTTTVQLVSKDATSPKYFPASATEWANFLSRKGFTGITVSNLWLCQESSGNLADSIGSMTLLKNGTTTYNNVVSGYTRTAVGIPQATAARFEAAVATGWNISTTSVLLCMVAAITAQGAADRGLMTLGGAAAGTAVDVGVTATTHVPKLDVVGVTTSGASDPVTGAAVRPYTLQYDRTNTQSVFYDDQEKVVGTYNAGATDSNKGFGSSSNFAIPAALSVIYGFALTGSSAEITPATYKSLQQALGWTIAW